MRFYASKAKRWVVVTVDDYIPVYKGTNKAIFMQPNNNEFWPLIIEKAAAKFMELFRLGWRLWSVNDARVDERPRFLAQETIRGHLFPAQRVHQQTRRCGKRSNLPLGVEEDVAKDKLFNILLQYRTSGLLAVRIERTAGPGTHHQFSERCLFSIMTVR